MTDVNLLPIFACGPQPVPRNPTDTQVSRSNDMYARSGTLKERLTRFYIQAGDRGMTDDEAGGLLGVAWSTAGAARHALNKQAAEQGILWIEKTPARRPTRSGRSAIVWCLTGDASRAIRAVSR